MAWRRVVQDRFCGGAPSSYIQGSLQLRVDLLAELPQFVYVGFHRGCNHFRDDGLQSSDGHSAGAVELFPAVVLAEFLPLAAGLECCIAIAALAAGGSSFFGCGGGRCERLPAVVTWHYGGLLVRMHLYNA
jgi:hypothetical protein